MDEWTRLRERILGEIAVEGTSNERAARMSELEDCFSALPAPLDEAIVAMATSPHPDAARFVDALFFDRIDDLAASAIRLLDSSSAVDRGVALDLLRRLVARTGPQRIFDAEPELRLPAAAEPALRSALQRGVDDYVIAQLLIRHGWAVDEAVTALRAAVVEALERDAEATDEDGIGYDLGCDLQVVAESFLHAGELARPHLDLLARLYDEGDASLRTVVARVVARIGGACARRLVAAWLDELDRAAARDGGGPSMFIIGHHAELLAALARLESWGAVETLTKLLPLAARSFFALVPLSREIGRLHAEDPEGVDAILRERLRDEDPATAKAAQDLLSLLGEMPGRWAR